MDMFNLSKNKDSSKKDSYIQQAQHIWSMLDDMASSNPESYKNFIDKTLKEGRDAMKSPETHMCVRTVLIEPKKCNLFINIFAWNRIPEPKTDSDPIPVFGKELEYENNVSFINIAFNSQVLEKYGKNSGQKQELEMLIDLAIQFIENQNNCKIDNSNYKILDSNIYGDLAMNVAKLTRNSSEKVKSDLELAKEALSSMGIEENKLTDNLLHELSGIGINKNSNLKQNDQAVNEQKITLIQEFDEKSYPVYDEKIVSDKTNDKIFNLEFKIYLPKVSSFKECDLDVVKSKIVLNALNYKELNIPLDKYQNTYVLETDKIEAKFVKKRSYLKVSIPLLVKN